MKTSHKLLIILMLSSVKLLAQIPDSINLSFGKHTFIYCNTSNPGSLRIETIQNLRTHVIRKSYFLTVPVDQDLSQLATSADSICYNTYKTTPSIDTLKIYQNGAFIKTNGEALIDLTAPKYKDHLALNHSLFLETSYTIEGLKYYTFRYINTFSADTQYTFRYRHGFWITEYQFENEIYMLCKYLYHLP